MKRILAMMMVVALMFVWTLGFCFGADTIDSETVPVTGTVIDTSALAAFSISESVEVVAKTYTQDAEVSSLKIENLTEDKFVTVLNLAASGAGDWSAKSRNDCQDAENDAKYINLSLKEGEGENQKLRDLTGTDGYDLPDGDIESGETATFDFAGMVALQTSGMEKTDIAQLVVTVAVGSGIDGYSLSHLKSVSWASGSEAEITAVVKGLDTKAFTPSELAWSVGDARTVSLSDGASVNLVLWDANTGEDTAAAGYLLTEQTGNAGGYNYTNGDKKTASYIMGIEGWTTTGVMNSGQTTSGSWGSAAGRTTVNGLYSKLPTYVQKILKCFETVTAAAYNGTSLQKVSDHLALPAAREMFDDGATTVAYATTTFYSNATEFNTLKHFAYFTAANRAKFKSTYSVYWLRSPYNSACFCELTSGLSGISTADYGIHGFIPFGCI
jgi:hypothetical protein